MNFKNKYSKYKYKYINLKNNNFQYGGDKIFDLSKKYNFTKNVQHNIKILKKKFGSQFKIKHNKIIIPVKLQKYKYKASNMLYYSLVYDQTKKTTYLHPLKIDFYNPINLEKKNITIIDNIQKTNNISGSTMIKLCLSIQKKLNVQKTYLLDGATLECNRQKIKLSSFKLIEKYKTFYMKFGFNHDTDNLGYSVQYPNNKILNKKLKKCINDIRKIKIKNIIKDLNNILEILTLVVKKNDYKNFEILHNTNNISIPEDYKYVMDPHVDIPNLFTNIYDILDILHKTKKIYLYQYLIELFNNREKCEYYVLLWKYFTKNKFNIIRYKNKTINRKYFLLFNFLEKFGYRWFVYDFN